MPDTGCLYNNYYLTLVILDRTIFTGNRKIFHKDATLRSCVRATESLPWLHWPPLNEHGWLEMLWPSITLLTPPRTPNTTRHWRHLSVPLALRIPMLSWILFKATPSWLIVSYYTEYLRTGGGFTIYYPLPKALSKEGITTVSHKIWNNFM